MLSRQAMLAARTASAAPRMLTAATPAAVRTFAAAAPDSKPPIALFGLDGTYASALYTAAVKTATLEPTAKSLAALGNLLRKDPKLVGILATPTLAAADKLAIVAELQKATGSAGQPTVTHFLQTLAENNRLGLLDDVVAKFADLIRAAQGQVELIVTSATTLDNKTLARLESAVAKSAFVGAGKKLSVKNKVNPEILGGLIVEVGDRTIDLSVLARVAKLNKLLTDSL
ncbi:ATP synthase oligomycin sensitivity conferral [Grosmannia clavigera kw1407]|uniref:ATP synthase subunit 5, mitochondrial n=1 Tax=Grosmannia clavigera (strain kw1407 / UAMH 11150) TaxID=655863 RepID=F0XTI4_GROCL|nr:ATP synthase oligomycin sensitivity conferral [Grosmannia clavigera kw1407]EFW98956.1 ATP synthase oligomycin sensitivity conferral [Grosmannia clavigera kw1407]